MKRVHQFIRRFLSNNLLHIHKIIEHFSQLTLNRFSYRDIISYRKYFRPNSEAAMKISFDLRKHPPSPNLCTKYPFAVLASESKAIMKNDKTQKLILRP